MARKKNPPTTTIFDNPFSTNWYQPPIIPTTPTYGPPQPSPVGPPTTIPPTTHPTTTVPPARPAAPAPARTRGGDPTDPNSSFWNVTPNPSVNLSESLPENPLLARDWAQGLLSQANLYPDHAAQIQARYSVGLAMAERAAEQARDNFSKLSKEDRKQFKSPTALYNAVLGQQVATLRDDTDQAVMLNAGSGGASGRGDNLNARIGYQRAMQQWVQPFMKNMSPEMAAAAAAMTAAGPAMADLQAARARQQQGPPAFIDPYAQAMLAAARGSSSSSSGDDEDWTAVFDEGGKKQKKK